ncbi:MAG TPA: hypothetical protein VIM34_11880, partial [Burkholderiaceae bacterium]
PYGWYVGGTIDDGSDDVLVYKAVRNSVGDHVGSDLARLDTRTGTLRSRSWGMPDAVKSWRLDAQHEPRMATAFIAGREKVYWRTGDVSQWSEVADFDAFAEPGFSPQFVGPNGQVLVTSRQSGDTQGLYTFDPRLKRLDPEPVVQVAGFDLSPNLEIDSQTGHLVGLHFETDRPQSYWFDADLQRLQRGVDAALPADRNNQLYCGRCE